MNHRLSPKDLSRAQVLAERLFIAAAVAALGVLFAIPAAAASTTGVYTAQPVYLFGVPVDFILFGLTLLGVAIFHHKTLQVALTGLAVVTLRSSKVGLRPDRRTRRHRDHELGHR